MPTVGGLFDGCGLLAYGLTLAGWEHSWLCEIDPWRRELLGLRWPRVPIYDDVRRIGGALPRLSDEQFAEALGLYAQGMSAEAIAERFPITRQALWERMKNAGVEMRPQQRFGDDSHFYRGGPVGEDWAHNKVEKALASGRLVRPSLCEECGGAGEPYSDGRSPIQAHHDDYNEPLGVRWLCQRCHHEWHKHNSPMRDEPDGGDAQGSLFDVPRVDLIAGGFPRERARARALRASARASATPRRGSGELRPRWVLVENVANILALHDGAVWGTVLGDLAALGYDCQWDCIPAAAFGAPHLRDRVIALAADTDQGGWGAGTQLDSWPAGAPGIHWPVAERDGEDAAHADIGPVESGGRRRGAGGADQTPAADPASEHRQAGPPARRELGGAARGGDVAPTDAGNLAGRPQSEPDAGGGSASPARPSPAFPWGEYRPAIRRWEQVHGPAPEPLVRRVDDRRARRVERSRLSALGDGVQVQLGRLAGEYLMEMAA